jgi:hypothetical protein
MFNEGIKGAGEAVTTFVPAQRLKEVRRRNWPMRNRRLGSFVHNSA